MTLVFHIFKAQCSSDWFIKGERLSRLGKLGTRSFSKKGRRTLSIFKEVSGRSGKGWRDLREMRLENLAWVNLYVKSLYESYFITLDSFENTLQRVEYFFPRGLSHENKFVLTRWWKRECRSLLQINWMCDFFVLVCLYLIYLYLWWIRKLHGSFSVMCILFLVTYHYFTCLYNITLST